MKKFLVLLLVLSLVLTSSAFAAVGWVKGKPAGTINPGTIDDTIGENNDALDLVLSTFQQGCKISYSSAAQITVGSGGVVVSNSAGTVRLMLANTSATTVTWADIDTGAEAASTTYYLYAIGSATTDTVFTVKISTSSSAPTGVTYYKRLGSFYNDSSSNIAGAEIINDDDNSVAPAYDYSSSASAYTVRTIGDLKICYGTIVCDGDTIVSNLPFASASSYTVILSNSLTSENYVNGVTKTDGTAFRIRGQSITNHWIAIGI